MINKLKTHCLILILIYLTLVSLIYAQTPIITFPDKDARLTVDDPILVFRWENVPYVKEYEIQFSFDQDFRDSYSMIVQENFFDLSEYLTQEEWEFLTFTIYWRLRAIFNDNSTSNWTEIRRVSKSRLPPPILDEPNYDAHFGIEDNVPTFRWHISLPESENDDENPWQSPQSYIIEFSIDDDFDFNEFAIQVDGNEWSMNEIISFEEWRNLKFKIYFRIFGIDSEGNLGPTTKIGKITKSLLKRPIPLYPPDNTHYFADSIPPRIEWEALENCQSYKIEFGYDIDFQETYGYLILNDTYIDFNDYLSREDWFNVGGPFYWHVCGIDNDGFEGPWSDVRLFTKMAPNRLLCFGDSITGGYGSSSWNYYLPDIPWGFNTAGYAFELQYKLIGLTNPQPTVCIYWIAGGQVFEGYENIEDALTQFTPSHFLIMMGIVDVVDPCGCPDCQCKTIDYLRNIIDIVKNYNIQPFICNLIPPNPNGRFAYSQEKVDELNQTIAELAQSLDVPFIDTASAFLNYEGDMASLYYDDLHPNDDGSLLIAESIYEVIKDWF